MSASSKKKLRKELESAQLTEKQLAQQKEAKKFRTYTTVFVAVLALVLVAAIGVISITAYNNSGIRERTTNAVTIGSHTLSNADLNYFYIDTINREYTELYEMYGDYASWFLGFDPSLPLNEQNYETGKTYADYYVDKAIEDAKEIYAMYDAAVAANHSCTEEELAEITLTIEGIENAAKLSNVSFNTYLKAMYGKGANKTNLKNYMNVITTVNSYQTKYHDSLTYDKTALDAYDKEHYNELSSFDYATFLVKNDDFLTGGTEKDGTTVYSEKEKDDARKAAEAAAKELVESKATSVDTLEAAIKAHSKYKDNSSAKVTKSEDALYTSINENIAQWLGEEDRKNGDITYLEYKNTVTDEDGNETEVVDGYYVVVMLGRNDNYKNLVNVRHILIKPTENSTNDDGTKYSSEEELAEAKKQIEAIRDEWLAGDKTEESFAKLANEKTQDDGSKTTGGLYEDVTPGSMVEAFDEWIFDSSRKSGDYDIVKTEFGYHLIYFVGTSEETYREHMITETLREKDYNDWRDGIIGAVTLTAIDTSLVELDLIFANN